MVGGHGLHTLTHKLTKQPNLMVILEYIPLIGSSDFIVLDENKINDHLGTFLSTNLI